MYGNQWKKIAAEFPERSVASIKCKYHNEIAKLQHGLHGSSIFKNAPLFNDIQGGRRMDKLFVQYLLGDKCIVGFQKCDRNTQSMIFRLFLTAMFEDIELDHFACEGSVRVSQVDDLLSPDVSAF